VTYGAYAFLKLELPKVATWKKVVAKAAREVLSEGEWWVFEDISELVGNRATAGSLLRLAQAADGAGEAYLPFVISKTAVTMRGFLPEDVYQAWAARLSLLVASAAASGGTGYLTLCGGSDDPAHVVIQNGKASVKQYDPQNVPDASWYPTEKDEADTRALLEAWQKVHVGANRRRKRAGLWGWLGADGQVAIEPVYARASDFYEGLAAALDVPSHRYGLLDPDGRWVDLPRFADVRPAREGLWCFQDDNKKWGFLDVKGAVVIPAQWTTCSDVSDTLAAVEVNKKWGFVDKSGALVIPAIYDYATTFTEGRGLVGVGGKYGFIDRQGKIIVELTLASAALFSDGRAPVHDGKAWGFVDLTGALVLPHRFAAIGGFSRGRAIVVNERQKGGVIDRDGREILPMVYHRIALLDDGDEPLLRVVDDRKAGAARMGLYDLDGRERLPATFLWTSSFREGLCAVQLEGGKFGYVDREGKLVIDAVYDAAAGFVDGRAIVKRGTTLQILEHDGSVAAHIATPPIIGVAVESSAFTPQGLATFSWGPSSYTLVNRNGELLTELGELRGLGTLIAGRMLTSWTSPDL
jgi:hypothetical protein